MTKRCTKCNQEKDIEAFGQRADRPEGRRSDCKDCRKEWAASYRKSDKGRAAISRAKKKQFDSIAINLFLDKMQVEQEWRRSMMGIC